jgi:glucokinase
MTILLSKDAFLSIAQIVRDRSMISRAEIARSLKMSPSTVGRVVDNLISKELIKEMGQRYGNGVGRPSTLLQLNSYFSSVLTVDLRLTEAYAAITDLSGEVIARQTRPLSVRKPQQSIRDLICLIDQLLASSTGIPPVETIVIGAPSIVDTQEGIIEWAPSLEWSNLPLKQILEARFHRTVMVENDVNLAVLGEFWKGAGTTARHNLVFVSVGTGIGAGIIINGEIYRGSTHAAGEVAYFITDVNVLTDKAGQIGNLENRVGIEGLTRTAQLVAQRYPTSQLAQLLSQKHGNVQLREILDLAETGDPAALVVFNELVNIMTIVICNISVLIDPEVIILGGRVALKWDILISAIHSRIGTSLLRPVNLIPSQLGNDALIIGGAFSALPLLKKLSG